MTGTHRAVKRKGNAYGDFRDLIQALWDLD